jgi:hypothetical protein
LAIEYKANLKWILNFLQISPTNLKLSRIEIRHGFQIQAELSIYLGELCLVVFCKYKARHAGGRTLSGEYSVSNCWISMAGAGARSSAMERDIGEKKSSLWSTSEREVRWQPGRWLKIARRRWPERSQLGWCGSMLAVQSPIARPGAAAMATISRLPI